MDLNKIISQMTIEEKAALLTGAANMKTAEIERLGIPKKVFADGPHGVRKSGTDDCISFPSLSCAASTWNKELIHLLGVAIAEDCIAHGVDVILGPGANIKRTPLCGRNFEYFSEDPILTGELAAAYINGVQSLGVGTCLKHFAMNNQERYRLETSVEVEIRVMREIYLKGFEIAVKKADPYSMMCAYNKVGSIWCAENKHLLSDVLRRDWGYTGCMISDWGAVRSAALSVAAGLDLEMPKNRNILNEIKSGLEKGLVTEKDIDRAVKNILSFVFRPAPKTNKPLSREEKHLIARLVAAEGTVLLKNEGSLLPITKEKYKKIAVIGEYAEKPLIAGQGSAEVYTDNKYISSPLEELKKAVGDDIEVKYLEVFKKGSFPEKMIWPYSGEWAKFVSDCDLVLVFAGCHESEDTEQFDRRSIEMDPNIEYIINRVYQANDHVAVILQSGSALILGDWRNNVPAIIQSYLGGEAGGSAIAEILTGKRTPSGKLSETFPKVMRRDLEYPGDGLKIVYREGFDVGYRYYDRHPEEICYPFGYGLSYTDFKIDSISIDIEEESIAVSLDIENIGEYNGSEVIQIYSQKDDTYVTRPIKELKAFEKIFLGKGRKESIKITLPIADLAYYNAMLDKWVVEPGCYTIMIGTSSRHIIAKKDIYLSGNAPYTVDNSKTAMIG